MANQSTPEELEAMQAAQAEALAAQAEENALLKKQLAEAQSSKVVVVKGGIPVKISNKNYLVVHGLIIEGARFSAAEIAASHTVCKELIAQKSSAIKEI